MRNILNTQQAARAGPADDCIMEVNWNLEDFQPNVGKEKATVMPSLREEDNAKEVDVLVIDESSYTKKNMSPYT